MSAAPERIYYDGECGLCHRWVRFALRRDRTGVLFRYAPLQGTTFATEVPAEVRRTLPDSLVLCTDDGRWLVRSAAVLHVLARVGGVWGALALALGLVPRPLRDGTYDVIARLRRRLFKKPAAACPLVPGELARRFDP